MRAKIHYAGSIDWHGGKILRGWAACCSGDRAIKTREDGNHSYSREEVTCAACHKMLAKQDAWIDDQRLRDRIVDAIVDCDRECGVTTLSSVAHLHEDHGGPLEADAHRVIKYFKDGSMKEMLENRGLKIKYRPKWEFDIEILRLDNWRVEE